MFAGERTERLAVVGISIAGQQTPPADLQGLLDCRGATGCANEIIRVCFARIQQSIVNIPMNLEDIT